MKVYPLQIIRATLTRACTLSLFQCLMILPLSAHASTNASITAPQTMALTIDERVQALSYRLRCLVCQNQSIAESNAALAIDLREQVRNMLVQGYSEDDAVSYLVERYGDFISYRPPLRKSTLLLWAGPFLLLTVGAAGLICLLVRRARRETPPLSAAERAAAEALLFPAPVSHLHTSQSMSSKQVARNPLAAPMCDDDQESMP